MSLEHEDPIPAQDGGDLPRLSDERRAELLRRTEALVQGDVPDLATPSGLPAGVNFLTASASSEKKLSPDVEEALEILRKADEDERPLSEEESARIQEILTLSDKARSTLSRLVKRQKPSSGPEEQPTE